MAASYQLKKRKRTDEDDYYENEKVWKNTFVDEESTFTKMKTESDDLYRFEERCNGDELVLGCTQSKQSQLINGVASSILSLDRDSPGEHNRFTDNQQSRVPRFKIPRRIPLDQSKLTFPNKSSTLRPDLRTMTFTSRTSHSGSSLYKEMLESQKGQSSSTNYIQMIEDSEMSEAIQKSLESGGDKSYNLMIQREEFYEELSVQILTKKSQADYINWTNEKNQAAYNNMFFSQDIYVWTRIFPYIPLDSIKSLRSVSKGLFVIFHDKFIKMSV